MGKRSAILAGLFLCAVCPPGRAAAGDVPEAVSRYERMLWRSPEEGAAFTRVYQHFFTHEGLEALEKRWEQRMEAEGADRAAGHLLIGLLAERRGRLEKAEKHYRKARDADPARCRPWLALGRLAVAQGELDEGIAAYEEALNRNLPYVKQREIFLELARAQQRAMDKEGALRSWRRLRETFPDDPFILEEAGEAMIEAGLFEEAVKAFQTVEQLAQDDPQRRVIARMKQAEAEKQRGRFEEAAKLYGEALGMTHEDSWLHREISGDLEDLYRQRENFRDLAAFYEKRLEAPARDISAALRLSAILRETGQTDEALRWLDKAARWAPRRPEIRLEQALLLLAEKRPDEAETILRKLVRQYPDNWEYRERQGEAAWRQHQAVALEKKRPDAGSPHLARALKIWNALAPPGTDDADRIVNLGDLFRRYGLREEALAQYRRAVATDPADFARRERLALYLLSMKKNQEAWRVLGETPPEVTREPGPCLRIARLQRRHGKNKEALAALEAGLNAHPGDYNLLALKWETLADLRHFEEAEKLFPVLLKNAPNEYFAEDLERRYVSLMRRAGTFGEKRKCWREKLEAGAELNELTLRLLARMEITERLPERAARVFGRGRKSFPESFSLALLEAEYQREFGPLGEQIKAWKRLMALRPKRQAEWLRRMALAYKSAGLRDEALRAARDAIAANPANPMFHLLYAEICYAAKRRGEGDAALRNAIDLTQNPGELRARLVRSLTEQGKYQEAIEIYLEAFDETDNYNQRHALIRPLVELHLLEGGLDVLLARFQRKARQRLSGWEYNLFLAEIHQQAHDLPGARQALQKVLSHTRDDPKLLQRLIHLSKEEENTAEWERYARLQAALWPRPEHDLELAQALLANGRSGEAAGLLEHNAPQLLRDPATWKNLFPYLAAEGMVEQFGQILLRGARQREDDWAALFALAEFFIALGDDDKAETLLWRILEIEGERIQPGAAAPPGAALSDLRRQVMAGTRAQAAFPEIMSARYTSGRSGLASRSVTGAGVSALDEAQVAALVYLSGIASLHLRADAFVEKLKAKMQAMQTPRRVRILACFHVKARDALLDEIEAMLEAGEYDGELYEFCHEVLVNTTYWNQGAIAKHHGPRMTGLYTRLGRRILERDPGRAGSFLLKAAQCFSTHHREDLALDFIKKNADRLNLSEPDAAFTAAQLYFDNNFYQQGCRILRQGADAYENHPDPRALPKALPLLRACLRPLTSKNRLDPEIMQLTRDLLALFRQGAAAAVPAAAHISQRLSPYLNYTSGFPNSFFSSEMMVQFRQFHQLVQDAPWYPEILGLLDAPAAARPAQWLAVCFRWWSGNREEALRRALSMASTIADDETHLLAAELLRETGQLEKAAHYYRKIEQQSGPLAVMKLIRLMTTLKLMEDIPGARAAALELASLNLPSLPHFNLDKELRSLGLDFKSPRSKVSGRAPSAKKTRDLAGQLTRAAQKAEADKVEDLAKRILQQAPLILSRGGPGGERRKALLDLHKAGRLTDYCEDLNKQLAAAPESVRLIQLLAETSEVIASLPPNEQEAYPQRRPPVEYYRRLAALRPSHPGFFEALSRRLLQDKAYDELAELYIEQLDRDFYTTLQRHPQMAEAFIRAKRVPELVRRIAAADYPSPALSKIHNVGPANSRALEQIGRTLLRHGHRKEAIQVWEKGLATVDHRSQLSLLEPLLRELANTGQSGRHAGIFEKFFFPDTTGQPRDFLWLGRQFEDALPAWMTQTQTVNGERSLLILKLLSQLRNEKGLRRLAATARSRLNASGPVEALSARAVLVLAGIALDDPRLPEHVRGLLAFLDDTRDNILKKHEADLARSLYPAIADALKAHPGAINLNLALLRRIRHEADLHPRNYPERAAARFAILDLLRNAEREEAARETALELKDLLREQSILQPAAMRLQSVYRLLDALLEMEMAPSARELLQQMKNTASFKNNESFHNRILQYQERINRRQAPAPPSENGSASNKNRAKSAPADGWGKNSAAFFSGIYPG